jgi:DNA-binding response OmpR family regulator
MARIMISERDSDVRRLLSVMVGRLGHEAIVLEPDVVDPPEVDLVLLDPECPNCLDEARLVRGNDPRVPVICLGPVGESGRFLRRGPVSFLAKPFTLDELGAAIQRRFSPCGSPL